MGIFDTIQEISIHALLAESDDKLGQVDGTNVSHFYPRSPCGERQQTVVEMQLRRQDFYPRSPCGERPSLTSKTRQIENFYPRSPCGERPAKAARGRGGPYFYPRSPCGERPNLAQEVAKGLRISIHALLAESDRNPQAARHDAVNFYPRSPCGERRCSTRSSSAGALFLSTLSLRRATTSAQNQPPPVWIFLSTLSLRRATTPVLPGARLTDISIHALLAESDCYAADPQCGAQHFYPRSPCGERLFKLYQQGAGYTISIHALLAESDHRPDRNRCGCGISIHALLAESDSVFCKSAAMSF